MERKGCCLFVPFLLPQFRIIIIIIIFLKRHRRGEEREGEAESDRTSRLTRSVALGADINNHKKKKGTNNLRMERGSCDVGTGGGSRSPPPLSGTRSSTPPAWSRNREEIIFTFPPHAHFEALLQAAVLALVAVVLVDGTVPVGPASVR